MSHVSARQETRDLVTALCLPEMERLANPEAAEGSERIMVALAVGVVALLLLLLILRGYTTADAKSLAKLVRTAGGVLLALAAAGLAVVGRIGFAIMAAVAAWALLSGREVEMLRRYWQGGGMAGGTEPPRRGSMSRAEALQVLGLKEAHSAGAPR
jgi:hypothetical protein